MPDDLNLPEYIDLTPRNVTCSRGRLGAQTYDAEVAFDKKHYVIGTGYKTRAEADAAAKAHVDALFIALRAAAVQYLKPYPEAKE